MWELQRSPKTPILYERWIPDGVFSFSPSPSARNGGSPASRALLPEDFLTPLSNGEQKYVIIPLHTPPGKLEVNVAKSTSQETLTRSPALPNFSSPVLRLENGTQPHCRSPEKRFLSPGPICRICHEGDQDEILLSPCNCSGSMQLVHKSCLEKWLSTSNTDHCELCMIQLPIRKETRPIWQWFSMTHSSDGPQGFYADLTCVILLTPLCVLSIYLCAIGAADYMKHGVWEGTGLASLSFFLMGTYLVWCYITIKFHWQTLKKWRTSNQVIHLVEKECRRRDQALSHVLDLETPRRTVIGRSGWNSPPGVHVLYPSMNRGQQSRSTASHSHVGNPPNVMDFSFAGVDVPAFL